MKKIFALLLIMVILLSFGLTASAETLTNPGNSDGTVYLTVNEAATDENTPIYSVTIEFTDLAFTYNRAGSVWNPNDHVFNTTPAGWADPNGSFKVINSSNVAVNVSAKVGATAAGAGLSYNYNGISLTLGNQYAELAKCMPNGTPPNAVFSLTASGEPDEGITANNSPIGSVFVTISPAG